MEYIDRTVKKQYAGFNSERTRKAAVAAPVVFMPTQASPVDCRQTRFARDIEARLLESGVRVETDLRSEKIGYKIREAQLEKIPYMLVVGDKEQESGEVAVRARQGRDIGTMKLEEFIKKVLQDIETKQ